MVDIAAVRSYHIIKKVADFLAMPVEKYGIVLSNIVHCFITHLQVY